ncbi:hypothetical protein [Marinibacterium profundimaris]|nr:hypothetical protein [Marinibacterium profundimaris]
MFRVAVIALALSLVLSLPALRTAMDIANGYVAAWLVRWDAVYGEDVVVVTPAAGRPEPAEAELRQLLARLDAAGPEAIVVVPGQDARTMPPASYGETLTAPVMTVLSERDRRATDPEAPRDGIAVRPDLSRWFGHLRPAGPGMLLAESGRPAFETLVADADQEAWWIGYLPEANGLPVFYWNDVLDGHIPAEFLSDRIVVVGMAAQDGAAPPDLRFAPVSQPVPAATYVAQSLQALQDGRLLMAPGTLAKRVIILLAAVQAGLILVRLRDRAGAWIYWVATAGIAGLAVLCALAAQVMFPVTEALVAFSIAWFAHRVVLDANRRRRQRRQLLRADLATAGSLRSRVLSGSDWTRRVEDSAASIGLTGYSFVLHDRPWRQRVVASGGAIQMTPRTRRAGARNGAGGEGGTALLPLPSTDFADAPPDEEFWCVRLRVTGGRRGSWIIRCPEGLLSGSGRRRAMLIAAAERLLSMHPDVPERQLRLTLDEQIENRTRVLAHEAATLDALMHISSTALAVFDLVGNFVRENEQMREIGRQGDMDFSKLSLVETVAILTKIDATVVSMIFSELLTDGESRRLLTPGLQTRGSYVLRLSLDLGRADSGEMEALGPIVLCELLDVTESERLDQARRSVAEFFDQQLRNDFEAIDLVFEMLRDPALSDTIQAQLLDRMSAIITRMTRRMETFDGALWSLPGQGGNEVVPQELRRALDEACDSMLREGRFFDVTIDYSRPELLSLVRAGADELTPALRNLGKLCVADAMRDSVVRVSVTETPGTVETAFSSRGPGLPAELVDAIANGSGAHLPKELQDIATIASEARRWGGALSIETGLDEGITCKLTLEKVL